MESLLIERLSALAAGNIRQLAHMEGDISLSIHDHALEIEGFNSYLISDFRHGLNQFSLKTRDAGKLTWVFIRAETSFLNADHVP